MADRRRLQDHSRDHSTSSDPLDIEWSTRYRVPLTRYRVQGLEWTPDIEWSTRYRVEYSISSALYSMSSAEAGYRVVFDYFIKFYNIILFNYFRKIIWKIFVRSSLGVKFDIFHLT